jgi:calcineurin-like phosphoesterase
MVNNEMLMENASKLQRAFFVLVKEGIYDAKAHKINLTVGIHTIAMGDNLYAKKDILAATQEIRALENVTYETRCE